MALYLHVQRSHAFLRTTFELTSGVFLDLWFGNWEDSTSAWMSELSRVVLRLNLLRNCSSISTSWLFWKSTTWFIVWQGKEPHMSNKHNHNGNNHLNHISTSCFPTEGWICMKIINIMNEAVSIRMSYIFALWRQRFGEVVALLALQQQIARSRVSGALPCN